MKHLLRPYRVNAVVALGVILSFGGVGLSPVRALGAQGRRVLQEGFPLFLHTPSQGFLGVDVGDVDQEKAQTLHLKDAKGAEITILDHDAPAGKAGLKIHDVILKMNGAAIENADEVKRMLRSTAPGRKIQLELSRDGQLQTVTVQLADRRKVEQEAKQQIGLTYQSVPTVGFVSGSGGDPSSAPPMHIWGMGNSLKVGALVEPVTSQTADILGVPGGLVIKNVARKSAADAAGLKARDVILQIGSETILTTSDWERMLRSSEGKPVQLLIVREGARQLVLLQVDGKRH